MKYDVFISYSRKDKEIADQICDVLKKNRITYFIDTEDISGGEEFSPVLAENINSCSLFLFIGSKNSYESKWTPKELHFALNHKESIAIIPYLIDEEPLPQKIEFAIADLNVRNIKDHPIDTILIEDIKTSKEKINIRSGKEDLKMAKAVADSITSSKHDRDYCVDFLIRLGDNNYKRGRNAEYIFPNETLHYFLSALSLLENSEKNRESRENRQIASVSSKIANILYSQEKYDDAASYLEKAIILYRSGFSSRISSDLTDCLLELCEITIMKEDYERAEQLCTELKDVLLKRPNQWRTDEYVLKMAKMLIKVLRAQNKNKQAEETQDEILSLFRNLQEKERFIELLVTFADANVQEEQFVFAEKYLTEALELDKNNSEVLIKLANVLEYNGKISNAKNTYEKAFHLAMDTPFKYGLDWDFLKLHQKIIKFLDKSEYYEEIGNYFNLAISKYRIDIYKGEIEETAIGNIYERYADWLTKHNHYNRSSRYLKKCQALLQKKTSEDLYSFDSQMFSLLTKRSINDLGLGYKDCANNNLKEALSIYKEMNDKDQYECHSPLYELWKKYNEVGFREGSELIKNCLIESMSINIDTLNKKAQYYTSLGWFLLLMDDYVHAQQPLEEALKAELKLKRNENAINNAKNYLARLYIYIGKHKEAEELLNEAISAFEKISAKEKTALHSYAESQNYFGRLRMEQKRYAESESYLELSLANYKKAAKISNKWEKDVQETALLLEQVKALQED